MSKSSTMLSETAYQYILDLIMSQHLKPGDRVPETTIASKFKISRTPVRDAIQRLANEGLLEIYPNRFVLVKEYSPEDITDIGIVRLSLDMISVKLASLFGSRSDFLKLAQIAKECEQAYQEGDIRRKRELDHQFHLSISEITRNSILIKFQKEFYLRIQYIMLYYKPDTNCSEESQLLHHRQIADALLQNDLTKAEQVVADHLISYYNLEATYPNSFLETIVNYH